MSPIATGLTDMQNNSVSVRLCSLVGAFSVAPAVTFPTMGDAVSAINNHAKSAGFTGLKSVEDEDSLRFTAKTPGGRSGRNIAFVDFDMGDY